MKQAPELANRALDLVVFQGGPRAVLADVEVTHLAWWRDNSLVNFVRLVDTTFLHSRLTASGVSGSDPNALLPHSAQPPWHESMRFFRLSQTTRDLYDAFRNLYLALESVFCVIEPVTFKANGKPDRGEGDWLKAALVAASTRVTLSNYVLGPSSNPVDDLYRELWVEMRNRVFHSKNGRPILLPQDMSDRLVVADALRRYAQLYVDLAVPVLNVRFLGGGLTHAGFASMLSVLADEIIIVTDDDAPVSSDDLLIAPRGGRVVELSTTRLPERPMYGGSMGSGSVVDLTEALSIVRKIGTRNPEGHLLQLGVLDAELDPTGFDIFECVIASRGVNVGNPQVLYST